MGGKSVTTDPENVHDDEDEHDHDHEDEHDHEDGHDHENEDEHDAKCRTGGTLSTTTWRQIGDGHTPVWTNGEHVKRPMRPRYEAVHQLLRHLERRNVRGAPRFVSVDDGFEYLTHLQGTAAKRPWPPALQSTEWLKAVGCWLREMHDATRDFELEDSCQFVWGPAEPAPGQVVTHGDLGPWNMRVDEGEFGGVIDWEFARFGDPLDDLAEAAFELGPLRENRNMLDGEVTKTRVLERLASLCDGYGEFDSDAVIDHVEPMWRERMDERKKLAAAGREPFVTAADEGALDAMARHLSYFRKHWKT